MKLFMIRHGATAGNLEKRYVGRTDEGLTEQAVFFLQEEALKLRELAGNVAAIITSPMERCLETAEILFPEKLYEHVPRIQKAGLSECDFGTFEYKNYLELSGDTEYQHFIDTLGREGFPGGETTEAFKARTVEAFQEVWKETVLVGRLGSCLLKVRPCPVSVEPESGFSVCQINCHLIVICAEWIALCYVVLF